MKNKTTSSEVLWNPQYLILSFVNFFSWLSYNMITPVLSEYVVTLGASLSLAGLIVGLFALSSLFSRPVSGVLTDWMNRKKLISVFTGIMAVSLLVYSLSQSIVVIIIFRIIHGVAFGLSSTASLVLVSECTPEKRMGEAISYYGVVQIASMVIGPSIGLWINDRLGCQACMLFGAAILFIAAIAAIAFPYRSIQQQKRLSFCLSNSVEIKVLGLSAINAAFTLINGVVSAFLVAFAIERNISGVGLHFTINAVVLMFSRIMTAKSVDKNSMKQNLYPAFIFGILSMAMIGAASRQWWLVGAGVVKALAQCFSQPPLQTAALRAVPPERRGAASSTIYIGGDLGQAVGPIFGGVLAQNIGYGNMFYVCIVPLTAAFIAFAASERRKKVKQYDASM